MTKVKQKDLVLENRLQQENANMWTVMWKSQKIQQYLKKMQETTTQR